MFLIVDTCQAYSMTLKLYSPNILGVGSSLVGEDSLSVRSSLCTGTLIKFRMTVPSRTATQDLTFKEWYFNRLKKLEFQLVFWSSCSRILLPQGNCLLVLVNDFVGGWLPEPLPFGQQVSFKSYLPSKKIYLSRTTEWDFLRALLWHWIHVFFLLANVFIQSLDRKVVVFTVFISLSSLF